jgi:hypothetical protein
MMIVKSDVLEHAESKSEQANELMLPVVWLLIYTNWHFIVAISAFRVIA